MDEVDGILHPLEIKKSSKPNRNTVKVFDALKKTEKTVGAGGIICMVDIPYPMDSMNSLIPANII